MTGIVFNQIPGSGLTAPLFAFEANSGGQFDSVSRLVLLGYKVSASPLPANTPTVCATLADADALCGRGSMLREMFRIARQNAPVQEVWLVALNSTGGALGVWTYTIGTVPAAGGTGYINIGGETIAVPVAAGSTAAQVATAINTALQSYSNGVTGASLPVWSTVASNVVTMTSWNGGAIMSQLAFSFPTIAGNIFDATWLTLANTVAPAGTPDIASALAAIGDQPADLIVNPWGDQITPFTAFLGETSGRWSYARQTYGHMLTCNTGTVSQQTTLGLALNDRHATVIPRFAGSAEPPWLWAAGMAARVLPWLSDCVTGNVSRNQTGLVVEGLTPPADQSLWPNYATRNTLNNSGISGWYVTADGKIAVDKLVTAYRLGPSGQPDSVFRDIQSVFQLSGGLSYIRAQLATEQGQKAIADANPGNLGALTTPAEIDASIIHAYSDLVARGVFENVDGFTTRLRSQRNVANPARFDVLMPMDRVNPLDILAVNAQIYAQFR